MYGFRWWALTLALWCGGSLVAAGAMAKTRTLDLGLDPIPVSGSCPQTQQMTIDGLAAKNYSAEILRGDKVRWRVKNEFRDGDWTLTFKNPAGQFDHFQKDEPHQIKRGSGAAHHETGPPDPMGAPGNQQWSWSYDVSLVWPRSDTADCPPVRIDPEIIISSSWGTSPSYSSILVAVATTAGALLLGAAGFALGVRRERRKREHVRPTAAE